MKSESGRDWFAGLAAPCVVNQGMIARETIILCGHRPPTPQGGGCISLLLLQRLISGPYHFSLLMLHFVLGSSTDNLVLDIRFGPVSAVRG